MGQYILVDEYTEIVVDGYMRMYPDANPDEVRAVIAKKLEEEVIDIPCTLHNDTYHEYIDTTVLDTFNWLSLRKPIISGAGSFFKQHSEYNDPSIKVLETWLGKRKKLKKIMFKYVKGTIEYNNYNTAQGNQKVICNAEYGESGTQLSSSYSIYIPPATTGSAKNLTTSLICILELFIANCDQYIQLKDINEMTDFMVNVLRAKDERLYRITAKFTPEEVGQRLYSMIRRKSEADLIYLIKIAESLSDDDRSKLMLAYNPRLVLNHFLYDDMSVIGKYLMSHMVDFETCTKESLQISGFGVTPPEAIAEISTKVSNIIVSTCVYPFIPNDVEVRAENAQRDLVCVVDTDSLMLHYPKLIKEFQTDTGNFKMSCICAAGFGTRLFADFVVPKFVEYFAINCGIEDKHYRDKLVFKNEFAYAMMLLFQKKMYLDSQFVQEGSPRNIHEIEAKGVSFKKRDTADFLEPLILGLCDKYVVSTDDISLDHIINGYLSIHDEYQRKVKTDVRLYTKQSVKDVNTYDQTKKLPIQMRGTQIWNEIMSTQEIMPLDRVYIVWLSYDLLERSSNPRTRRLLEMCRRYSPDDACVCIPESYDRIPDWISEGIDSEHNIDKLLAPFKQLLKVFGVYLPENKGSFKCTKMLFT